ncbi:MAG: hypothetical protein HRT64_07245, partial [Erythrobacter sp.]|nr:hypothetical protein [Erythrobacter sp.]
MMTKLNLSLQLSASALVIAGVASFATFSAPAAANGPRECIVDNDGDEIGDGTNLADATGDNALACGQAATATGDGSTAIGNVANAVGESATAVG